MPDPFGWMTLQDYANRQAVMQLVCTACFHGSEMSASEAVERFGANTLPDAVEKRTACQQPGCGGRARLSWRLPMAEPDQPPTDPTNFRTPGRSR